MINYVTRKNAIGMLLKNKVFSSLYFYLSQLGSNTRLGQSLKTTVHVYDRLERDKVTYRFDGFKTTLCLSSDIILKEVTYKGYLEFVYDKRTKDILVTHVPYVQYGEASNRLFSYAEKTGKRVTTILKNYYECIEKNIRDFDENGEILRLLKSAHAEVEARKGAGNKQREDEFTEEEKYLWSRGNGSFFYKVF